MEFDRLYLPHEAIFPKGASNMNFLPFDYLVISNQDFDLVSLQDTFSFFSACGIRKFIFLLNFDRSRHTVAWIKDRQKLLEQSIRLARPKGLIVQSFLNFEFSQGIVYDPTINRILSQNSSFLFVSLPFFCDDAWVDADLNYLLYQKKLTPILSSFEGNIRTNSQTRLNQIFTSKAYRLSLDLNYITAADSKIRLDQIISREISVIPCISHSLSNYVGVCRAFEDLRGRLGASAYAQLSRNFFNSEKYIFSS